MFYLFGSENSQDYDIIVIVDDISDNIEINHQVCKHYNNVLSKIYTDKVLNCNIATIRNNMVEKVFKGDACEVQNAIIYTYNKHVQQFPLIFEEIRERDKHAKLKRVARGILSFYSRSALRTDIKTALRSSLLERLQMIERIDLSVYYEFNGKKESYKDVLKVLSFQFGQLFALYDGYEEYSYTKNDISYVYPDLKQFMDRCDVVNLDILEKYKKRFLELAYSEIPNMEHLYENKYF